jgi:hypothetical protein
MMAKGPVFTPEWPRYAVLAHIVFWGVSALFLLSCIAGYAGLIGGQIVIILFWLFFVSGFALCLSSVFSGRLYVGNQVFARQPLIGWAARLTGIALTPLFAFVMWFVYGLLFAFP